MYIATVCIQKFPQTSSLSLPPEFFLHMFLTCSALENLCPTLASLSSHQFANTHECFEPHPGKQTSQLQSNKNITGNEPKV